MLIAKLLQIVVVICLQLSACQFIYCSASIYCVGSKLDPVP